ncbi:MAG TPA: hypothetical protein VGF45_19755 [Polyangia bacterium]
MASSAPPHTVFLLSPANLGGERAAMVMNPRATFALAQQLHSPGGAALGDLFAFVSGLYFRGKKVYSETFGRPPLGMVSALVITPGEGLRPLDEPVTPARLETWKSVEVDVRDRRFIEPLLQDAESLERAYGAETRFVLLGSVATNKYVQPLTRVFGDHLLFPIEFVGRGDMSRGAIMLRAARDNRELTYAAVEGARLSTRIFTRGTTVRH